MKSTELLRACLKTSRTGVSPVHSTPLSEQTGETPVLPSAATGVSKHALMAVGMAAALCACAHPAAQVRDVDGTQYTETIGKSDRILFGTDRASRIRVEPKPLPPSQQREEYFVSWRGREVRLVKFEYRQVNIPDKILIQTVTPADRFWSTFTVAGDDFLKGGPISAWRVSLWDGDRLLAERKSVLW